MINMKLKIYEKLIRSLDSKVHPLFNKIYLLKLSIQLSVDRAVFLAFQINKRSLT